MRLLLVLALALVLVLVLVLVQALALALALAQSRAQLGVTVQALPWSGGQAWPHCLRPPGPGELWPVV